MNITLAQVKAFERIARLGSFHAAARHLHLTQPSVSQRIHDLEDQLGAELFLRRGPKVTLTSHGTQFLPFADQMLGTMARLAEQFRTPSVLKGTLRLGVSESFALACLSDLILRLEIRFPNLKSLVQVGDTGTISKMIDDHQLDLAVISEPNVAREVQRIAIGANELAWFADASLDILHNVHTPAELCKYHLFISPPPSRLYTTATRWFSAAAAMPERLSMCNSLSVTKNVVLRGLGIGLMPIRVIQEELLDGLVVRLDVEPVVPRHEVWICYRDEQFGSDINRLVEAVSEVADEHRLFR